MARPKGTGKYHWNQPQAERVERLGMIGLNDDQIAKIEKMSEATLCRIYAKELTEGRAKGIGAVAKTLYSMAVSGKNPAATFFFMKCRARWKEVHVMEHSGPDGKPIETKNESKVELSDEQQVKIAEAILSAKRK